MLDASTIILKAPSSIFEDKLKKMTTYQRLNNNLEIISHRQQTDNRQMTDRQQRVNLLAGPALRSGKNNVLSDIGSGVGYHPP